MNTPINPQTNTEQRTDDWHTQRIGMITGSRVAAILGTKGAFGTRDSVMREMVREALGAEREFKGNVATQWGTDNEPTAVDAYEEITGYIVEEISFVKHPLYEFLGASPDGLIGADGLLEVKCPYSKKIKTLSESLHYADQIQLQLECTDRHWCDFFVWTPNEFHRERVYRDKRWLKAALPKLKAFHEEFHSILADPEKIKAFTADPEIIHDDFDWLETASQYCTIEAQIRELTKQKDALKGQLIGMAEPTHRTNKGGGVTVFPTQRKGSIDYSKVPELKGVDLEPYRKQGSESWTVKAV